MRRARGRKRGVLPGMLMAAGHAKNDIPSEIHEARARHPGVEFHYGRHLHLHAKIIELCRQADRRGRSPRPSADSIGTIRCCWSSAAAAAIPTPTPTCRSWPAFLGKGWASAGRRLATSASRRRCCPSRARALPADGFFARILYFPFFLFTGILEKRIRRKHRSSSPREHPETEFVSAGYLDAHPLLFEVFLERAEEAIHGSPNMNCELCKYRVQLPGFEQSGRSRRRSAIIITCAASAKAWIMTICTRTIAMNIDAPQPKHDSPRMGAFYGVGVGPGDPELITLKAARCWPRSIGSFTRRPRDGATGLARQIVASFGLPTEKFRPAALEMSRDRRAAEDDYGRAAREILSVLEQGHSVAWITEGDPSFYSSFGHLRDELLRQSPRLRIEIVPGISSPQACRRSGGRASGPSVRQDRHRPSRLWSATTVSTL